MKKVKYIFSFFCFLLMTQGCTTVDKTDENSLQRIEFDLNKQHVNIHDVGLISDIAIVNLANEEVILGEINKVIKKYDRIYILNKNKTHSVFIYDNSGNLINFISNVGNGPEEYIQLTDIFTNSMDTTLNLVSRMDRKILKYDLEGANFKQVEYLPKNFRQFSKLEDGYVGYMGNYIEDGKHPKNIFTLSKDLQIKGEFLEIDETWDSKVLDNGSVFSNYEDKTYFIQPMDFNVYSIGTDMISKTYYIDFGDKSWPQDLTEYGDVRRVLRETPERYIQRFYDFQETDNFLIIKLLIKGQYCLALYNKSTQETFVADLTPYTDKYFFPFGKIVGIDENAIYTSIEASEMKVFVTGKNEYNNFESQYPEQIKRLREKLPNINEEGNPFLIIYYFKK